MIWPFTDWAVKILSQKLIAVTHVGGVLSEDGRHSYFHSNDIHNGRIYVRGSGLETLKCQKLDEGVEI